MTSFAQLALSESALEAVRDLGYKQATPVQSKAIGPVAEGQDLIACAKTGTGKTAAFSLPAMDRIAAMECSGASPRLLITTPTRELADQIEGVCRIIGKRMGLKAGCVVGGVDIEAQAKRLQRGVDALIGTPGRIIDLVDRGYLDLSGVKILVLDEADRMLDMGFLPQVRKVVDSCPEERQTLLFSATIDRNVERHLASLLHDPVFVEVAKRGEASENVRQYAVKVDHRCKPELLRALLRERGAERIIIFARTKRRVDGCLDNLSASGYPAVAIHSGKSQAQRRRALEDFAKGRAKILVATDVIARGIDIESVNYVVNYDVPVQAEDYIHRIGRTGRAGEKGLAITFVTPETQHELDEIEALMKTRIEPMEVRGFWAQQSDQAIAARATRRNARKDPELESAAKEYAAYLKKAQRRKEQRTGEDGTARKPGKKAKSTSKAPSRNNSKTTPKAPSKSPTKGPSKQGKGRPDARVRAPHPGRNQGRNSAGGKKGHGSKRGR